jgi:hypothetical protein
LPVYLPAEQTAEQLYDVKEKLRRSQQENRALRKENEGFKMAKKEQISALLDLYPFFRLFSDLFHTCQVSFRPPTTSILLPLPWSRPPLPTLLPPLLHLTSTP